jgi:serine/threonine protein phosphatase PrpC
MEPFAIFENTGPIINDLLHRTFEAHTSIGLRPTQEDRLIVCPQFLREDAAFFGVFDGTVGDDASHFIQRNIVRSICSTEEFSNGDIFSVEPLDQTSTDNYAEKIGLALKKSFLKVDSALIDHCTELGLHYASSTGVTAFLWLYYISYII